jgi:hypothetical protein
MKQYPSIPGWKKFPLGTKVIAFDKLDGSNIRFEWSKKRGWYKFGTKTQMLDESHPVFGQAISLFMNKYAEPLVKICVDEFGVKDRVVAFCEFLGPNSFAGTHVESDVKDVVLLDVDIFKKGFIPPRQFIKIFDELHLPKIIHDGNFNHEFIEQVRNNEFGLTEGVVVKSTEKIRIPVTKVKTIDWLTRLKAEKNEVEEDQE